jgi:tetratricopeptide (TPR) repeat protein
VSWISGRTDVLCAVFLLLAYDCLSRTMDRRTARRGMTFAIGLTAYMAALLSKEMAASLVGLLALHGLLSAARERGAGRASRSFPWHELGAVAAVTVLYILVRASVLGLPDFSAGARSTAIPFRPGVFPSILLHYWRILLLPGALQLDVSMNPPLSLLDGRVLGGLALLVIQAGGAFLLLRRRHPAGLGLGWILLSLLPVAHLVPLVFRALVTEYWVYIPSIGFVVALAAGAASITGVLSRRKASLANAPAVALGVLVLIGFVRTPGRSTPLRSEEDFHLNEVRVHPDRVSSWISLASEYGSRGEIQKAFQCIREAEKHGPRERGVQLNLGNLYEARGEVDSAEAAYRREILYAPGSAEARVNLADLRLRKGDEVEAARLYREILTQGSISAENLLDRAEAVRAASLAPDASIAWSKREEGLRLAAGILGSLHQAGARLDPDRQMDRIDLELRLGRIDRAREAVAEARAAGTRKERLAVYEAVIDMTSGTAGTAPTGSALDLAREMTDLYATTGRTSLALPIWRSLLRAGSLSPEELNHIAVATMRGGEGRAPAGIEAEQIWRMLLEEKPDHPLALLNLGGVGLAAGDRARARSFWTRFLALYPDRPEAADVREKLREL